jgi:hypothetical protein
MRRWRSATVTLVVLGAATAGVAACSRDDDTYRRNGYATREACMKDYQPEQCKEEARSGGFGYFGPWYMSNRARAAPGDPGPGATAVDGRSQAANQTAQTRRGGFGATASSRGFRGG